MEIIEIVLQSYLLVAVTAEVWLVMWASDWWPKYRCVLVFLSPSLCLYISLFLLFLPQYMHT